MLPDKTYALRRMKGKRLTVAQQLIFALRLPCRLSDHAMEIKINLKKKIIIVGTVPNGYLGASHDFVHLLPFVKELFTPNSTVQGFPLLCCACTPFTHGNSLVIFQAPIWMFSVI